MAFAAYSKVVFLDGIRVPVTSISSSWGEGGIISFTVSLMPSMEAERILPSTVVHVYHLETSKRSLKRKAVEVDGKRVGKTPFDVTYLKTDFLADNAAKTLGDMLSPHTGEVARHDDNDDLVLATMLDLGAAYLMGGIVTSVASAGSSSQGQQVVITCRGYDIDMDLLQLIQIVKGRGTLTDRERRFGGQDTKREGKPKSLLTGNSRKAFGDALAKLLVQDKEFAAGVRNILAQYPATVNDMWLHRYAWDRISAQIAIVEKDSSIKRLISESTFKNFLRDQMQRMYTVPLRQTMEAILGFVGYKIFSVPAPAFWPIVPRPEDSFTEKEDVTAKKITQGSRVLIEWGPRHLYDRTLLTGGGSVNYEYVGDVAAGDRRKAFYYRDTPAADRVQIPSVEYAPYYVYGTLHADGRTVSWTLPVLTPDNKPILGGGYTYYAFAQATPGPAPAGALVSTWQGYGVDRYIFSKKASDRSKNIGSDGTYSVRFGFPVTFQDMLPHDGGIYFKMTVNHGGTFVRKTKKKIRTRVPAKRPARYYSNELCRLNTYVILPNLWWACPPRCNIVVPEMLESVSIGMAPIETVTRLIGKLPPGKSKGKVSSDKFLVPQSDDLNKSLEDVFDDMLDSKNLQRTEYIGGVRAEVSDFGLLSKLAAQDTWETYMHSQLTQDFWDRRLAVRTATIRIKTAVGLVPGAPCLVIRGTGETESGSSQLSPELQALLAKLRKLRALRARLVRARAGLLAQLARVRALDRWIKSLTKLSTELYTHNMASAMDETTVQQEGLWVRTGGAAGSSITQVNVGRATSAVRGRAAAGVSQAKDFPTAENATFNSPEYTSAANLGISADSGSLSDPKNIDTFKRLLGDKGADIHPSSAAAGSDDSGAIIARLPPPDELDKMGANLSKNSGGMGGCVAALTADIKLIDAAIKELTDKLHESEAHRHQGRSFVGYVRSISESSSASQSAQLWTVQLTHVRHVGEDLDWDGVAGDDVENVIIFGDKGYLDEKYSTENIGEKVYLPMFGSPSMVDESSVQAAFKAYVAEPLAVEEASIKELLARMQHPTVCGKKYWEDSSKGELPVKPDTNFALSWYVQEYLERKRRGATSDQIFDWIEELHTRPWMTIPDAYRGFPLGWDRDRETSTDFPHVEYQPWEADQVAYGFSHDEYQGRLDAGPGGERLESAEGNPAEGFWRGSLLAPRSTSVSGDRDVLEYLSYGDKLDDDELAMLRARQERVFGYLRSVADKTTSRKG